MAIKRTPFKTAVGIAKYLLFTKWMRSMINLIRQL